MNQSVLITKTIVSILDGSASTREINELYKISTILSCRIIRNKVYNNNHYFSIITKDNNYLDDEAASIIAVLFRRNDKGIFTELAAYFSPKKSQIIQDPQKSLFYLKRLISSKIKQELINRFMQEDIEGFRIYRNILLAPNRNAEIGKFTVNYKQFYYWKKDIPLKILYNPDAQPHDEETIKQWSLDLSRTYKTTPAVLVGILKRCQEDSSTQNYVAFHVLVSSFKAKLQRKWVQYEESSIEGRNQLSLNSHEITNINQQLRKRVEATIQTTYFNQNKVSEEEKASYTYIIMEYFNDLIQTGEVGLLPKYLETAPIKDHLGKDWRVHRSRIEYMIKQGKLFLKDFLILT